MTDDSLLRIYVHGDGNYLSLAPNDGRGDVLLEMPDKETRYEDHRRVCQAVAEIQARLADTGPTP